MKIYDSTKERTLTEKELQLLEEAKKFEAAYDEYRRGMGYANELSPEYDEEKAFLCFERAAAMGHTGAQWELGERYEQGVGVAQNTERALYWYCVVYTPDEEARIKLEKRHSDAENGNPDAQAELAEYYLCQSWDDAHKELAVQEAERWYRSALEKGCVSGDVEYMLGVFCMDRCTRGENRAAEQQAVAWFLCGAEHGSAHAQLEVADMCRYGVCGIPQDLHQAYMWYSKAFQNLEQEVHIIEAVETAFTLGVFCDFGVGCERNESAAHAWYKRALSLGEGAMTRLMGCAEGARFAYLDAVAKYEPGSVETVRALGDAAEAGSRLAMLKLAEYSEAGMGVPRDGDEAARLREKAGNATEVVVDML